LDYLGLVVWWGDGDIEGAQDLFETAAELCRNCEDARGYTQTIQPLAGLRRNLKNQHARILPLLEESLTIFSQLGDTWSVGRLYHNLCGLFTIQQDYARARLFAEQALANARLLMGWVQAVFDKIDYEMLPVVRMLIDQHIRLARDQLGSSAFEAWQEEGRAMTLEHAIESALSYQTT